MNPFISVIIPHHLNENQAYLDLAIESVMASEGVEFECIVVADTEYPPTSNPDGSKIYYDRSLDNGGKKVNYATKYLCSPRTTHYMMMSDDVMIAKHTLEALVSVSGDIIQNPMSNSDNGSQFFTGLQFPIKMDIGDILSPGDIINFPKYPTIVVPRQWVAFYCTMIPKTVWDKVGELDLDLDYRGNDVDYCFRAAQHGVQSAINFGAFALHFGDKTLPKCTTEADLNKCSENFQKKWANFK